MELIKVRGELRFVLVRGKWTQRMVMRYLDDLWHPSDVVRDQWIPNLITNVGRANEASLSVGAGGTAYSHIAVGTTVITPAATDTSLTGELFRKACSTVTVLSSYTQRYVTTFLPGDFNNTVRGFGLFDAAAAGNMGAIVSANVLKDASHSLVAEWRWLVSVS